MQNNKAGDLRLGLKYYICQKKYGRSQRLCIPLTTSVICFEAFARTA